MNDFISFIQSHINNVRKILIENEILAFSSLHNLSVFILRLQKEKEESDVKSYSIKRRKIFIDNPSQVELSVNPYLKITKG